MPDKSAADPPNSAVSSDHSPIDVSVIDAQVITPPDDEDTATGPIAVPTPTNGTTADRAAIAALQAELAEAHQREAALEARIVTLEAALAEHTTITSRLQKELGKQDALKAELDEVKTTALKLAQTNSELLEKLAKQAEVPAVKPAQPPAPAPLATKSQARDQHDAFIEQQRRSLNHPIFPNQSPAPKSSDPDVGWFD